jgi:hypothetical protein
MRPRGLNLLRFAAVVSLLLHGAAWSAPSGIRLSAPRRVGRQTVRVAYQQTDLDWLVNQKYFVVDGRRVALPPERLGYDRVFSAPRWIATSGRISALKFWQFNKRTSERRPVTLSFPRYRVLQRGPWRAAPGGDTVPDPPP